MVSRLFGREKKKQNLKHSFPQYTQSIDLVKYVSWNGLETRKKYIFFLVISHLSSFGYSFANSGRVTSLEFASPQVFPQAIEAKPTQSLTAQLRAVTAKKRIIADALFASIVRTHETIVPSLHEPTVNI